MDHLHFGRIRSVLVDNGNDISQQLLLQEEASRHADEAILLEIGVTDLLSVNENLGKLLQNGGQLLVHLLPRLRQQLL